MRAWCGRSLTSIPTANSISRKLPPRLDIPAPHSCGTHLQNQPDRVENLSDEAVARDRAYWDARLKTTLGRTVTDETSLADVCAFVDKTYRERILDDFKGERAYLTQPAVQVANGKLRTAIAGLYAWRVKQSAGAPERQRMLKEAELAFKQAYVLGPANTETVMRFTSFLMEDDRRRRCPALRSRRRQTQPRG
jgi:hypothetical protein